MERVKILLATTNEGKIREIRRILADERIELTGPGELMPPGDLEAGATFEENALLKARFYRRLGLPVVAEDSGLEVTALGGAPGVYSARYAGPDRSDQERYLTLLEEMKSVPPDKRQARFVCVVAFIWDGGERVFRGEAEGLILTEPRGEGGFGYDPLFYFPPAGKSFAEMSPPEKAQVSHRGLAFKALGRWLTGSGLLDTMGASDRIGSFSK